MEIQTLNWKQVKKLLASSDGHNPLIKILDQCIANDEYEFYFASYKYGEYIIRNGQFLLDSSLDNYTHLQEQLDYNAKSNPFGIVIENSAELFLDMPDRTIPYTVTEQGALFGSWFMLDNSEMNYQPKFEWDMTAGVRSTFMLPKISSNRDHTRVCKHFGITQPMPKKTTMHWNMFQEIATKSNSDWRFKIIYFPKKIIQKLESYPWKIFKQHLTDIMWVKSSYMRNVMFWNSIYTYATYKANISTSAYDLGTLKHIYAIMVGEALAFKPATTEKALPLKLIQEAYYEIYGLKTKNFLPTVMIPCYEAFHTKKNQPVYYSFQYPTNTEFPPRHDSLNSNIQYAVHLEKIHSELSAVIPEVANAPYSPIEKALKKTLLNFSHIDLENQNIQDDSRFQEMLYQPKEPFKKSQLEFPKGSTFLRSLLQIKSK